MYAVNAAKFSVFFCENFLSPYYYPLLLIFVFVFLLLVYLTQNVCSILSLPIYLFQVNPQPPVP